MKIKDFAVERYFAKYEFSAQYMLSSSDCDGYSMDYVLSVASADEKNLWESLKLGYTETVGSEFLRKAIKGHYKTIQMDEIVVSSPGEANFILMNVLLNKGDNVICMSPMYQSLYQVSKDLGCSISFWKPHENTGGWHYDITDLKKLISSKTKLIVVNFPHNPTGFSPTIEEYHKIIELARERGITIFSDEMYRYLNHNKETGLPSMCDLYENSISLWGTAKTFGLAGLRLGWLTSKNKGLLKKVEKFKDYLSICNSAPSEVLGTIALNNMDKFVIPNMDKIRFNISLFSEFHKINSRLIDFEEPLSGSTAFIRLKINEPASVFAEKLVKSTGIMLLPSETFEYGKCHARIGFGRKNMPEMLSVFGHYIRERYF